MKISAFKEILSTKSEIAFELPNGELVPNHFHVTEVGQVEKLFIDCGGTIRKERKVGLQLWEANDYDHRLHPEKLIHIIELSQDKLQLIDAEIEVEYQGATIGKYHLEYEGGNFLLKGTSTDCLAKENCGIPVEKKKVALSDLSGNSENACCSPDSGCC